MTGRDDVKSAARLSSNDKSAREFSSLTADVSELFDQNTDPKALGLLLFKLAQERQQTNKFLEKLVDQYDQIMFHLKTQQLPSQDVLSNPPRDNWMAPPRMPPEAEPPVRSRPEIRILADQDQFIMKMVDSMGHISANEVKNELGYKGANAASQRLNMLVREGHLRKVQAGKKVVFMARIQ